VDRDQQRKQIEREVAEFLASGGKIQKVGQTKVEKVFMFGPGKCLDGESVQTRNERIREAAKRGGVNASKGRK
jgi:hypothetical protein